MQILIKATAAKWYRNEKCKCMKIPRNIENEYMSRHTNPIRKGYSRKKNINEKVTSKKNNTEICMRWLRRGRGGVDV